uniref:Uncharacterized protein n=1 Tax=Rhizophora mucronata TaxID=61149 RepID=A0A2P2NRF5_RHIMU
MSTILELTKQISFFDIVHKARDGTTTLQRLICILELILTSLHTVNKRKYTTKRQTP